MPLPLVAGGVDVRLGWRVLAEGLFLPTNLDLDAFQGVHDGVFLPTNPDLVHVHEGVFLPTDLGLDTLAFMGESFFQADLDLDHAREGVLLQADLDHLVLHRIQHVILRPAGLVHHALRHVQDLLKPLLRYRSPRRVWCWVAFFEFLGFLVSRETSDTCSQPQSYWCRFFPFFRKVGRMDFFWRRACLRIVTVRRNTSMTLVKRHVGTYTKNDSNCEPLKDNGRRVSMVTPTLGKRSPRAADHYEETIGILLALEMCQFLRVLVGALKWRIREEEGTSRFFVSSILQNSEPSTLLPSRHCAVHQTLNTSGNQMRTRNTKVKQVSEIYFAKHT